MSPLLFVRILSIEARKLMSYRVDFWVSAVATFIAELTVAYYLWLAIFDASGSAVIGGYSFDAMVLYYVLAILVGKLVQGQRNTLAVAQDIYEGTLTRYLVFPLPYAAYKYAEHLGTLLPGFIQAACFGTASAIWLGPRLDADFVDAITLGSVSRAVLAIVAANLLAFTLRWSIQCVAFWADNVWSLNVMLRFVNDFLGGLVLPLSLFPPSVVSALEYTPFPYFFYFPVTVFLGQVSVAEWWLGMAVIAAWTVGLGALGRLVWRRGQLAYTGVGI